MTYDQASLDRQLTLEEEMRTNGIARYRAFVAKAKKNGEETATRPLAHALDGAVQTLAETVQAFYDTANSGRPGPKATAYPLLCNLEPAVVAFLTAKSALDQVSSGRSVQSVAGGIGKALEEELWFRAFNEQKPFLWREIVKTLLDEQPGPNQRQAKMRRAVGRYGIDVTPWTIEQRHHVGMKCIDMLIEATGMFEVVSFYSRGKTQAIFQATAETVEWVARAHSHSELLTPMYMPMIVPPVDWTTPFDGGYVCNALRRDPLVKTRNEAYLEELSNHDMPMVYNAVNIIQRTAWQINRGVLDVIVALWESKSSLGKLPSEREEDLPEFPANREDKVAVKEWKRVACKAHQANGKRRSRRIACGKAIWVARRFAEEAAIYFPHSLDFRGRVYPKSLFLHPQGNDHCKGMLRFAEGKPLGEQGAAWLAVHGANTWGYDKVDLESRIRWVEDNEGDILASARSPLDNKFWADADKPFQFLAFCLEWAGYKREGVGFVSHLPIALDGSCNGLQNFSMALRDEVGGAAVNLVPSDKPSDIYQQVANVVTEKVRLDACTGENELAVKWLNSGLICRKLCKKPVMTLPYGAKQYGMRNGLAEFIDEAMEEMKMAPPFNEDEVFPAAAYIAGMIWDSIGEVVIAARAAMDFLQATARLAASEGLPIHWVAPSGFPVVQEYRELVGKVVKTQLGGSIVKLTLSSDGDKLDKKRQSLGVSPNFVHALDSAHLMRTVVIAECNDVRSFAMIHDSFGTHASDTSVLSAALREAFVDQYKADVLGDFRATIMEQLLPQNAAEMPPVPPMGTLEPTAVLDSAFFFA